MKRTKRLQNKINKCTSIYLVALYAKFAVREYKWTGRLISDPYTKKLVPEVWDYYDGNGTCDEVIKRSIYNVTIAPVFAYSFDKYQADRLARLLQDGLAYQKETKKEISKRNKYYAYEKTDRPIS